MKNEEENNDFLQQFFKDNNLFAEPLDEKKSSQEDSSENLSKKNSYKKNANNQNISQKIPDFPVPKNIKKLDLSKKDINLKKLFQSIENEKQKEGRKTKKNGFHQGSKKEET